MSVELIPSVLAHTPKQLRDRVELAEKLSRTIHLDIMDGHFVSTRSVSLRSLQQQRFRARVELHAMVRNLHSLVPLIARIHPRRVYIHVESSSELLPFFAYLRSRKIKIGLAINPSTPLSRLQPFIGMITSVLVMGVQPGGYHGRYNPKTPSRIATIRRRYPRIKVAVDGGTNAMRLPKEVASGVKRVIVGSDVMLSADPLAEWQRLKRLTK